MTNFVEYKLCCEYWYGIRILTDQYLIFIYVHMDMRWLLAKKRERKVDVVCGILVLVNRLGPL